MCTCPVDADVSCEFVLLIESVGDFNGIPFGIDVAERAELVYVCVRENARVRCVQCQVTISLRLHISYLVHDVCIAAHACVHLIASARHSALLKCSGRSRPTWVQGFDLLDKGVDIGVLCIRKNVSRTHREKTTYKY